ALASDPVQRLAGAGAALEDRFGASCEFGETRDVNTQLASVVAVRPVPRRQSCRFAQQDGNTIAELTVVDGGFTPFGHLERRQASRHHQTQLFEVGGLGQYERDLVALASDRATERSN